MTASEWNRLLPPVAASRLSQLDVLVTTLQQSATFAVGRANEIAKMISMNPGMATEDRDQLNREVRDLEAQRNDANARHKNAAGLLGNINVFVTHLNATTRAIEVAPDVSVPRKKNETLKVCLARLRDEIVECKNAQRNAAIAPLPPDDLKAHAKRYVASMAAQVVPRPMMQHGAFSLAWSIGDGSAVGGLSPSHVLALMASITPELVEQRLIAIIDAMPAPRVAPLSEEAKAARLKELGNELDRLERAEEATVRALHGDGQTNISRRPDANPMAVLGIRYKIKPSLQPVPRRAAANGSANGTGKHPVEVKQERVRLVAKAQEAKDARARQ